MAAEHGRIAKADAAKVRCGMYFFFTIPFWVIVLAALVVFSAGSFVAGIMAVAFPYFTAAVTIIWLVVLVLVLHGEKKKNLWLYRISQWLLSTPFIVMLFLCLADLITDRATVFSFLLAPFVLPVGLMPLFLIEPEDSLKFEPWEKPIRAFSIILNVVVGLGLSFLLVRMFERNIVDALLVLGWIK